MRRTSGRSVNRVVLIWGLIVALAGGVLAGVASGNKLKTRSATTTVPGDETGSVTADCDPGTKAVSGGFETEFDFAGGTVFAVVDSLRQGARSWTATAQNFFSGNPAPLTSFAYCRDEKVKSSSEDVDLEVGEDDTVVATCPSGTKALSGGFDGEFDDSVVLPQISRKLGKRKWEVTGIDYVEPDDLTAQVNCREGRALRTKQATATVDNDNTATAIAKCKRRQRVVSGGFAQDVPVKGGPFTYESRKAGKRRWRVSTWANFPTDITAYAYCEKKKKKT
jgi:hypothetical protein